MDIDFLQKQMEYIKTTANTLSKTFELPVDVEFVQCDGYTIAVVDCESPTLFRVLQHRLFDWQVDNTTKWDQPIIHITDEEGKWSLMGRSQHNMILQC